MADANAQQQMLAALMQSMMGEIDDFDDDDDEGFGGLPGLFGGASGAGGGGDLWLFQWPSGDFGLVGAHGRRDLDNVLDDIADPGSIKLLSLRDMPRPFYLELESGLPAPGQGRYGEEQENDRLASWVDGLVFNSESADCVIELRDWVVEPRPRDFAFWGGNTEPEEPEEPAEGARAPKRFPAHRIFLRRCEYFAGAERFAASASSAEIVFTVSGLTERELRAIVKSIYTSRDVTSDLFQGQGDWEVAARVLPVADMWLLSDLKEVCLEHLFRTISSISVEEQLDICISANGRRSLHHRGEEHASKSIPAIARLALVYGGELLERFTSFFRSLQVVRMSDVLEWFDPVLLEQIRTTIGESETPVRPDIRCHLFIATPSLFGPGEGGGTSYTFYLRPGQGVRPTDSFQPTEKFSDSEIDAWVAAGSPFARGWNFDAEYIEDDSQSRFRLLFESHLSPSLARLCADWRKRDDDEEVSDDDEKGGSKEEDTPGARRAAIRRALEEERKSHVSHSIGFQAERALLLMLGAGDSKWQVVADISQQADHVRSNRRRGEGVEACARAFVAHSDDPLPQRIAAARAAFVPHGHGTGICSECCVAVTPSSCIICPDCNQVQYCSEQCREKHSAEIHMWDCGIWRDIHKSEE